MSNALTVAVVLAGPANILITLPIKIGSVPFKGSKEIAASDSHQTAHLTY